MDAAIIDKRLRTAFRDAQSLAAALRRVEREDFPLTEKLPGTMVSLETYAWETATLLVRGGWNEDELVERILEAGGAAVPVQLANPRVEGLWLTASPPSLEVPSWFKARTMELAQLAEALGGVAARVGVWGPPGIGKTTLIQEHFRSHPLDQPLWLRVGDLFGTGPDGRWRGPPQWDREALLAALGSRLKSHPRSVLVFDDVQASPFAVRWLSQHLGDARCVFAGWDLAALPTTSTNIRLGHLSPSDGVEVMRERLGRIGRSVAALEKLSTTLDGYPLALDLAARRLQIEPDLSLEELADDLAVAGERLRLQGPSIDRELVVLRAALGASVSTLSVPERRVLVAMSGAAISGVSRQTVAWLGKRLGSGPRPTRAVQLGLLAGLPYDDWRGASILPPKHGGRRPPVGR